MNKFKLILTICLVAILTLTMGVATFASNPLTEGGEELVRIEGDLFLYDFVELDEYTTEDYEKLLFSKNGILFKAIIEGRKEDEDGEPFWAGYFVNIYNPNDIIGNGNLDDMDDINFDYTIIPLPIWQALVELFDYDESEATPITSNNSILGTFSAVPAFIVNAVNSATGIFWANGALTMLGILAIIAVAFGVCLLVVSLITRFMGFRG